jgi:hypothetical protein
MITLVANTATLIVKKANHQRYIRISSDSTTVTRLALTDNALQMASGGYGFTAYQDVIVELEAGQEIWAKTAGTPNISAAEVTLPRNAVILR